MKDEKEQMNEEGINEALIDKNVKWYINFKIRALKRKLRLFFWIAENKWWAALIFVVCIGVGIWVAHKIDINRTLENTTGVRFHVEEPNKVSNKD